MAMKVAVRYVSRRLSSSGKVLSEEEKAAENVFIKVNHDVIFIYALKLLVEVMYRT